MRRSGTTISCSAPPTISANLLSSPFSVSAARAGARRRFYSEYEAILAGFYDDSKVVDVVANIAAAVIAAQEINL